MVGPNSGYAVWRRRCWMGAVVLLVSVIAPMIYCMGWLTAPEGTEAVTLSQCANDHPLQYPTTLFLVAMGLIVVGLGLRIYEGRLREEKRVLDARVRRAASRNLRGTPVFDNRSDAEVPEVIEVDEDLEFGEDLRDDDKYDDADTLMAFLQEAQREKEQVPEERPARSERPELKGLYYPPGLEEAAVLYLDGSVEATPVSDGSRRVNNPDLPHVEVDAALRHAFQLVLDKGEPVVVRVMPGVYQAALEIPDRVVVVNHRLPADATVDQRLGWLREQSQVDHPDRVTFLTPSHNDVAVRALPGQKQGIFGCYLVGRKGVAQTGLKSKNNAALAVVHCAFESFSRSGAIVEESGEDLPGRRVQFVGCLWRGNAAPERGGGLSIQGGAVSIEASIFDSNTAPRGGAIAAVDTLKPVRLERSLLQRNRALTDKTPGSVEALDLVDWQKVRGLGGALLVSGGLCRVVDTIFDGNDAAIGGGALASLGARVVLKSTGRERGICSENRARAGGALLAVGWPEQAAMIRASEWSINNNLGISVGGGAAALGRAVLTFDGGVVRGNRATGEKRGFGGGIAAWRGAKVRATEFEVTSNQASGDGGGLAVLNGFLKLEEGCSVNRNRAQGEGGGVMVITLPDKDLERRIGQTGFTLPFKVKFDGVRITDNVSRGSGGGLRAGNMSQSPTFSVSILVRRPDWICENRGGQAVPDAQDIWISWAGRHRTRDGVKRQVKLALK